MKKLIVCCLAYLVFSMAIILPVVGQNNKPAQLDTFQKKEFKRLDIFPAISYSPETQLTLGVIGITYFDLSKGDLTTPISNLEFLGVYTLNKQIVFKSTWEMFSYKSKWRSRGEAILSHYPDRNYGMGNDANALVVEVDQEGVKDTVNYLSFSSNRIKFSPAVLRKIRPNLYFGLQYDMEYLFKMETIPDQYFFLNADSSHIQDMPVDGLYSGIGFQLLFDTRDRVLNPLKGTMIEMNNLNYGKFVGSDYRFTRFSLDARQYLNTLKNQTLALRLVGSVALTEDEIPMRALSRVGGNKFIRGYFKGTYQDYNMMAFEAEYRLPLWSEGADSRLWQVWKRLGFVGFISGAQVCHELSDLQFDRFNFAVGGGLRILLNPESRVNLRIDYAVGLHKGADGFDKRQSGLYFFLGEAF